MRNQKSNDLYLDTIWLLTTPFCVFDIPRLQHELEYEDGMLPYVNQHRKQERFLVFWKKMSFMLVVKRKRRGFLFWIETECHLYQF
jgi:hypothetical protein